MALVSLPCFLFLAAGSPHQAFGPVNFGMGNKALAEAHKRFEKEIGSPTTHFTAEAVRKHFVNPGRRYTARLESRDSSVRVFFEFKSAPTISEVDVYSIQAPARDAESVKGAWEVFQDIGDCKLPRVGQRGAFPSIEQIAVGQEVVTDKWEGEGIRIELLVKAVTDPILPDPVYCAILRATEIQAGK